MMAGMFGRPKPKCDDRGPGEERCLLDPEHEGFHKSNMMAWPNPAESMERWAAIGRHLLTVGPLPHLSKREIEYALSALERSRL
jgi:hypothetical protein